MADYQLSPSFIAKIRIRYPDAEIITGTPIGYSGWELDGEAAVIRTGGEPFLVTTDHGRLVRQDVSWLIDCLATYREWIRLTQHAITVLSR